MKYNRKKSKTQVIFAIITIILLLSIILGAVLTSLPPVR